MRFLSIDQSMSSCAIVVFDRDIPIFKDVIHTTRSSNPKPWQHYFDTPAEQIAYIVSDIFNVAKSFHVEHVVLESLSFASSGNATRDLAGLFFSIQVHFLMNGYPTSQIHSIAPTSVKSWARELLPEGERISEGGKGKIKMGKNEMMRVCDKLSSGFLNGYTKTGKNGGSTDLADAYLIGRCFLERYEDKKIGLPE